MALLILSQDRTQGPTLPGAFVSAPTYGLPSSSLLFVECTSPGGDGPGWEEQGVRSSL